MDRPHTVAFIPLRGASKSIPFKNIKPIAGKPLAYWTTEAALACERIDEVFVSSDAQEIRDVVGRIGHPKLTVIDRSPESATDDAPTEQVMLEFAEQYDFETIVLIQATSPLLEARQLTEAFSMYEEERRDSLFAAIRQKQFIWREEDGRLAPMNYDPQERPMRQGHPGVLVETGAFYITSKKRLLESRCRISGSVGTYEMPREFYFEVDEPEEWRIIEMILQQRPS